MDEISAALIARALDGLNQRYLFIAQNIANASSPNYRPVRVSFEENLREAASSGPDTIRAVEPRIYFEDGAEGPMRLDLELAAAAQTASRYRALVDILGRQMALHRALLAAGGPS